MRRSGTCVLAEKGRIHATVLLPHRNGPAEVWLRLRHPEGLAPRSVFVNDERLAEERVIGRDIRLVPGVKDTTAPVRVTAEYR